MTTIVAVSDVGDWALHVPGVEVVLAKDYLSDPAWTEREGVRVFNLCRRYRYQSEGYYVSLLAMARRHTAIPNLTTLLEMRSRTMVRAVDDELEESIQRTLRKIQSSEFVISIYFGENLAKRYAPLAQRLFNLFPAPLLRATFQRSQGRWRLQRIEPIPARLIPEAHLPFVREAAERYFARPRYQVRRRRPARFHLAILTDPKEGFPPSNLGALRRFERAGEKVGFGVDLIGRDDFSRLAEFDALFIRTTTYVNHYTFRFAQSAQVEGLAVIDDPQSIIRCGNKVFLAEALLQAEIPTPRTVVGNRHNLAELVGAVGLPCVLKYPDSAFSQGVHKCESEEEMMRRPAASSRSPTCSWRRSSCPPSTTGAWACSATSRCTPAATTWWTSTGRSCATTGRRPSTARSSPCRSTWCRPAWCRRRCARRAAWATDCTASTSSASAARPS